MTRLHQQACAAAYKAHPDFELGAPEHHAWLAAYDAEFKILLLLPGAVL